MESNSEVLKLLDLIPRDRLARYLDTTSLFLGAPLRVLDPSGAVLSASRSDGAGVDNVAPDAWAGVGDVMGDSPMTRALPGGFHLMAAPVQFKGQPLGYLSACVHGADGASDRAMSLLSLSVSHLESIAEAGLDVESLAGEVVRVYEELALIYGLTARLGAKVDVEEICRIVIDEAKKILDPTDIVLQLADYTAGVFRTVLAIGDHESLMAGFTPGLEEGVVGQAYTGQRSVLVCEVDEYAHFKPRPFPVRRLLAVPLAAEGKVIGMISATDKRDKDEFNSREEKLISAISSIAAIAIKNAQLYSEIKDLFEGFIHASVTAVEYRDPTTAGHSNRVAAMCVELARKVSESDLPPFRDVSFTQEQLLELKYAGLLHDFGKIGVREAVLRKGTKLSPERTAEIMGRFGYIMLFKKCEALDRKHAILLRDGKDAYAAAVKGIESELESELAGLERCRELVQLVNDPNTFKTELPELDALAELAEKSYIGPDGAQHPYLAPAELRDLKVPIGSLTPDERREIQMHVTHSHNFLTKMPWTSSFPDIVNMVYAHHERMDGSGYPRGLKKDEIPLQARIMAVADSFDALTAWDRPYKKAVSTDKALFILEMEAAAGRLDPHLVQVFRDAKVYKSASRAIPFAVHHKNEA